MSPPPVRDEDLHALVDGEIAGWSAREAWVPAAPPSPAATPVPITQAPAPTTSTPVPAPAPSGVAQLAAVAHAAFAPEIGHAVEVEAGDEAHLVRWLSTRLGRPVVVPRLDSVGLTLIGGRLLPTAPRGVAAQLMYEDRAGKRLTLYFKRPEAGLGETAFQFAEGRYGTSVFWWSDERFAYALVAALPREELLALARGVHEQLDR